MGVPKFYRWISERFPCLSETVKEYQIPEFDNMYLDMNGIIHPCSHPNDDDPHFRITEEQIFKAIFHYIEVLFRMVQPRKIFFMAVDGVAPRAKMNQQRGRRFRSAREAAENDKKAREKGEVLPTEARFDSNCITPGTGFMARLDKQLQYFVAMKLSTDRLWQNVKVVYSGHQTPGEGEHKIMEYIRYARAQPSHNPDTRHCLYGLDADLMMLGLATHEPHFSLLREEVRFGKQPKSAKRITTPEETTFHLLHLSLMREYIDYEFAELKRASPAKYNLESIIDDWVFMGFLVGNDFIPHLPGLHINEDGLPILFSAYKRVFRKFEGYLNEGGTLNLRNFELFMEQLREFDIEKFEDHNDNMKYIREKKGGMEEVEARMNTLEEFNFDDGLDDGQFGSLDGTDLSVEEVKNTLKNLGVSNMDFDEDTYVDDETQFEGEFRQHKRHYYMSKMGYKEVTPAVLYEQATTYVRGLQWILHYYYNGLCSWSWYYPHHYSPYISDVHNFINTDMVFEKSKPFLPFEQLLAVLPPLSAQHLPEPYHRLMLDNDSAIKDFYPDNFETDLNGKQMDWEAVVLIPFIDEKRLLEEMKPCNLLLSDEEACRNMHGPMSICTYTSNNMGEYKSPMYFPSLSRNFSKVELVDREKWNIDIRLFKKGLLDGVSKDVYYGGFPTLKHIPHEVEIKKAGVKIFRYNSRGDNFILKITKQPNPDQEKLATRLLGNTISVAYPHLVDAKVVAIFNSNSIITLASDGVSLNINKNDEHQKRFFDIESTNIKNEYQHRWGIVIGPVTYILLAKQMSGRGYIATSDGRMTLEKQWSDLEQPFAYQVCVEDVNMHESNCQMYQSVEHYYTTGSKVFMLGTPHYGCMGEVIEVDPAHKGRIRVAMKTFAEPDLKGVECGWTNLSERYMKAYQASSRIGVSPHFFARFTGMILIAPPQELNPLKDGDDFSSKLNIGLNLKSNKKNEEVVGFTHKCLETKEWLYSDETVKALKEYNEKFPEVFEYLHKNVSYNGIFFQDDIFPKNYKERVPELTKWLREAAFTKASRCKCGSQFVDSATVSEICKEVDKFKEAQPKIIKMQVRPHLLFKPNQLQGFTPPDSKVDFKLFDRVVNIRDGFSIPLGLKGTIIGVQPADEPQNVLYDVLFDEAFNGGLTLSGPSSKHRCYTVHWAVIINLSYQNRKDNSSGLVQPNIWSQEAQYRYKSDNATKSSDERTPQYSMTDKSSNFDMKGGAFSGLYSQHNNTFLNNAEPKKNHQSNQPYKNESLSKLDVYANSNPSNASRKNTTSGFRGQWNSHGAEVVSMSEPPNPNQLPMPRRFGEDSPKNNAVENNFKAVHSPNAVPFVIYGTTMNLFQTIQMSGIPSKGQGYILCFSRIPNNVELLIYLNAGKLFNDGVRMMYSPDGQVLVYPNFNRYLSAKYIQNAIHMPSGRKVWPISVYDQQPYSAGYDNRIEQSGNQQRNHQPFNSPKWNQPMQPPNGGMGRGASLQSPSTVKPLQLYENIWSQMKSIDNSEAAAASNSPSKAPTMPSATLSDAAKADVQQQIVKTTEVSGKIPEQERRELSLTELFQAARESCPQNSKAELTPVNLSGLPQFDFANSAKPNLSPHFVPTQVIRMTPMKKSPEKDVKNLIDVKPTLEKAEETEMCDSISTAQSSSSLCLDDSITSDAPKDKGASKKGKKPKRNRLAVKFN